MRTSHVNISHHLDECIICGMLVPPKFIVMVLGDDIDI